MVHAHERSGFGPVFSFWDVSGFLNAALGTRSAVLFIIQKQHWHEGLDDGTFLAMEQVQVLG